MNAIVVGGSLGGLFAGVALKSTNQGHNVRILERNPKRLHDQGAGLVAGGDTGDFFERFDKNKTPMVVESPYRQYLDAKGNQLSREEWKQRMSSWDLLYNILRWNFDGDCDEGYINASETKVNGNNANGENSENVGSVTYSLGCTVQALQEVKNSAGKAVVEVTFTDADGATQKVNADLVVGADGPSSTIRELMDPKATREYVGYVVWRGTIPESIASASTWEALVGKFTFFHAPGIQILAYAIPGPKGSLEPGKRLINWAWYNNYPEGSPELKELMTDTDGRTHRITLPPGKMNPEVLERQKEYARKVLPPQFAEIVNKTKEAFVQAVTDVIAEKSTFFDGKVVLVGDALAGFRPHTAASTSQAAFDSNLLHDLIKGDISLTEFEKQTMEYATEMQAKGVEMGNKSQFSNHPMACAPGGR